MCFSNSRFLDDVYDQAIIGYDSVTGAIIYDDEKLVNLALRMFDPDGYTDRMTWGEQFEFCITQIQSMFCQDCPDGVVPPILMTVFPEDYLAYYKADLHPDVYP